MNVLSRFYTYDKQEVLVIKEGSSFYNKSQREKYTIFSRVYESLTLFIYIPRNCINRLQSGLGTKSDSKQKRMEASELSESMKSENTRSLDVYQFIYPNRQTTVVNQQRTIGYILAAPGVDYNLRSTLIISQIIICKERLLTTSFCGILRKEIKVNCIFGGYGRVVAV